VIESRPPETRREPEPAATAGRRRSGARRAAFNWTQRNGLFFALLALVVYFASASDRFLTGSNIKVILLQVAVIGIISVPGAMLILTGHVDLAVGSVMVLAGVVFGQLMSSGSALGVALLAALGTATVWGIVSGWLISYLGLSAIIVTLGGLAGARGVAEVLSDGKTTFGFGETFAKLGNSEPLTIPLPVWILAAAFLVGGYLWFVTPLGRHMASIGADRMAATSLGVSVRRIPLVLYACSGLAAGLGGLILTSQLDGASLAIGQAVELDVITAILLGGVSFAGGRGSLVGVLFGVLFIGVLQNGLILVNVSPFFSNVAVGLALVFAAGLDVLYQRLERIPVLDPEDDRTRGATT
jgi:ribose/xylose/arabinose/galactoside ABC-type transport system permease subunit